MISRCRLLLILLVMITFPAIAQDALNLPSELYILLNDGQVQRYGLGAAGVQIVTPESDFVLDFGVASDNNWIAYRTQDGLYLANMYQPDSQQQMDASADVPPIRGQGDTLVWSPDNTMIAYTTLSGFRVFFRDGAFFDMPVGELIHLMWSPNSEFFVAETKENIWWIYRRVGMEMLLASVIPSSVGLSWSSDNQLIFAPAEGGLIMMNLNDNNSQTPLLDASRVYGLPYKISDGVYRVFSKSADNVGLGRLMLVTISNNTATSEEIGVNDVEIQNVQWAPGGDLLIAFQGGVMALVEPVSGQGFTLPITSTVSYSWGAIRHNVLDTIAVTGNLYFLGNDAVGLTQVWQIEPEGIPVTVTPAEGNISAFDVSPDGRMIAYVSDNQLWIYELGAETATSLVTTGATIRTPHFSRDGSRIAYSVDSTQENPDGGIWIVSITGEDNSLILRNGPAGENPVPAPPFYRDPQFAPNINALLVKVGGSETTSLSIVDVNTLEVLQVGQYDDGFWLRDGRLIAWGTGIGIGDPQASEIVVLDPNTQAQAIPLFSLPPDIRVAALTEVSANQLRLITRSSRFGPSPLTVVNVPLNGTAEKLLTMNALVQPVFSPDGTQIAGLTHPDGLFTFMSLQTSDSQILSFPSHIKGILWR